MYPGMISRASHNHIVPRLLSSAVGEVRSLRDAAKASSAWRRGLMTPVALVSRGRDPKGQVKISRVRGA